MSCETPFVERGLVRKLTVASIAVIATFGSLAVPATARASGVAFHPISMSFPTSKSGWALGMDRCQSDRYCYELEHTSDAGVSWAAKPVPSLLEHPTSISPEYFYLPAPITVTFANSRDGWIYGIVPTKFLDTDVERSVLKLWATTDGGQSWRSLSLSKLNMEFAVMDVAVAKKQAYLLGASENGSTIVRTSPVGENVWRRMPATRLPIPAGGTEYQGAIVTSGSHAWLVAGNDRGVDASAQLQADGTWAKWSPPCASSGFSYSVPVVTSARDMVAQCTMGGYNFTLPKGAPTGATVGSQWLYASTDGGRTFRASSEIRPMKSAPYWLTVAGLPAEPSPGVFFTTRPIEEDNVSTLIESTDSGRTWSTVLDKSVLSVDFLTPRTALAIVEAGPTATELMSSHDGGAEWSKVASLP